jgi:DNA-binding NarL/FixJ family response regulator
MSDRDELLFRVRSRSYTRAESASADEHEAPHGRGAEPRAGGAPRILVVDDEPSGLETTVAQLAGEPYSLVIATGGVEAIAWLQRAPIDLVICDISMPEVDGYAVCREVKSHFEWQYVPVILVTAFDTSEATIHGLDAGADGFISKPVLGAELRAYARALLRVRAAYARLRAVASDTVALSAPRVGDDRRAQLVEDARLTSREREVLDLLLLGRNHKDIATVLGISERTSKFHQANLLDKLGAESRIDLLRLFV